MKILQLRLFIIATFCLWHITGAAQNISLSLPEIIPASPEAAALAKYINYPVDYSTGLAKIEIPLFEIKAGELTLPVTLSYHASGIKVNENAGWIGLGWTLNAEPMISRSVKGNPDEMKQIGYLNNNSSSHSDRNYLKRLVDGGQDEQPDDFYYRLLDKSGGFLFKKDVTNSSSHSLLIHPYEPIKVIFDKISPYKFEITDENGVYYSFGTSRKNKTLLEYSDTGNGQNLTGWKAAEIISASKGDTVSFDYYNSKEMISNIADYITVEDDLRGSTSPPTLTGCKWATFPFIIQHTSGFAGPYNSYILDNGKLTLLTTCNTNTNFFSKVYTIYGKKIKQIKFRGGRVDFEIESAKETLGDGWVYVEPERWVKLKSIRLFDSNNNMVKEIVFHRSFFGVINALNNDFNRRDRLDEITVRDYAGRVVERYRFGYNGSSLPAATTKDFDHWGYYNAAGNTERESAVPVCTVDAKISNSIGLSPIANAVSFQIGSANKEPNETAMQYGTLKSITYPEGGTTTFAYQTHQYMENGRLKKGGGLRIASIQDYDPESGKNMYRIFRYGKNEDGAGIIHWNITPEDYMYEQTNEYFTAAGTTRYRTYYCSTLSDLFFANGSSTVYDTVTEYRSDTPNATGTLGKTVYTFDQSRIYRPYRVEKTNIYISSRAGWMHGKLIREAVLHRNGDTLSTTVYRYGAYKETTVLGGIAYREQNPIGNGDTDLHESIQLIHYQIYTGALRPISVKKKEKFASVKVESGRESEYLNTSQLLYPVKEKTTASDGVTVTDQYKYPHDMTGLTGEAETARQKLISNWHISALLEHSQTKDGKTQTAQTDYAVTGNAVLPKLVKANTGKDRTFETRIRYHSYDASGNPACISYEDGPMIIFIWGYNRQYPVAKIESTSKESSFYNTVVNAIGSAGITVLSGNPTDTQIKNIFTGLRGNSSLSGAMITSYTYKPLVGRTSETDPSGRTVFYEYDTAGRLKESYIMENGVKKTLIFHEYHFNNK